MPWPLHINTLYQESTTQLRFIKRQQWVITNYLLILLGGIFGIIHTFDCLPHWTICAAIGIIWVSAITTISLLITMAVHMGEPRRRLAEAYKYLTVDEREKFNLDVRPTSGLRDLPFLAPLLLVCLFGAVIVSYAIAT